ncbi:MULTISPECIES: hypothetical protein [Clostridium]|uniref:Uncharacterized protein n=1 Tax=Candidatus Clostridium helianthi TaxID=3381660 RepID=A0ABW8SCF6_9CLOT|nr:MULTISPECIES: hypothetical protein [Clostridium]
MTVMWKVIQRSNMGIAISALRTLESPLEGLCEGRMTELANKLKL